MLEALVALVAEHAPLRSAWTTSSGRIRAPLAALGYLGPRRRDLGGGRDGAGERPTLRRTTVRRLTPDAVVRLAPLTAGDLAPLGIPSSTSRPAAIPAS